MEQTHDDLFEIYCTNGLICMYKNTQRSVFAYAHNNLGGWNTDISKFSTTKESSPILPPQICKLLGMFSNGHYIILMKSTTQSTI